MTIKLISMLAEFVKLCHFKLILKYWRNSHLPKFWYKEVYIIGPCPGSSPPKPQYLHDLNDDAGQGPDVVSTMTPSSP